MPRTVRPGTREVGSPTFHMARLSLCQLRNVPRQDSARHTELDCYAKAWCTFAHTLHRRGASYRDATAAPTFGVLVSGPQGPRYVLLLLLVHATLNHLLFRHSHIPKGDSVLQAPPATHFEAHHPPIRASCVHLEFAPLVHIVERMAIQRRTLPEPPNRWNGLGFFPLVRALSW